MTVASTLAASYTDIAATGAGLVADQASSIIKTLQDIVSQKTALQTVVFSSRNLVYYGPLS